MNEIEALATSAEGLFDSDKRLDALVTAMKAKKKLLKIDANNVLQFQVDEVLSRSLFGILEYNRLSGNTTSVWDIDFSPDGETLVSSDAVDTIKLWHKNGQEIQFTYPIKLDTAAGAISFSHNNNLLAIAKLNGRVSPSPT